MKQPTNGIRAMERPNVGHRQLVQALQNLGLIANEAGIVRAMTEYHDFYHSGHFLIQCQKLLFQAGMQQIERIIERTAAFIPEVGRTEIVYIPGPLKDKHLRQPLIEDRDVHKMFRVGLMRCLLPEAVQLLVDGSGGFFRMKKRAAAPVDDKLMNSAWMHVEAIE